MKPKFLILTSIFGGAVISVLSLATSYESLQATPSSYPRTCHSIKLSGEYLQATCNTSFGGLERASIKLRGIFNINGQLVENILIGNNSFIKSCKQRKVNGNQLSALCLNNRKKYVNATITLEEITNVEGNLTYEFDAYKRGVAKKISDGHAYNKHAAEFATDKASPSRKTFKEIALDVILNSQDEKSISDARKVYWKKINLKDYIPGKSKPRGTVLIVNPRDFDNGTMFVPPRGKKYFDNLK